MGIKKGFDYILLYLRFWFRAQMEGNAEAATALVQISAEWYQELTGVELTLAEAKKAKGSILFSVILALTFNSDPFAISRKMMQDFRVQFGW